MPRKELCASRRATNVFGANSPAVWFVPTVMVGGACPCVGVRDVGIGQAALVEIPREVEVES